MKGGGFLNKLKSFPESHFLSWVHHVGWLSEEHRYQPRE